MAEEQLDHIDREPFSSSMDWKVSVRVHAVGIGMATMEPRCLALQYNFCTSQGIIADHAGQGIRGYAQIPCHGLRIFRKQAEEAPDTILFQCKLQTVKYIIESTLHKLDRSIRSRLKEREVRQSVLQMIRQTQ